MGILRICQREPWGMVLFAPCWSEFRCKSLVALALLVAFPGCTSKVLLRSYCGLLLIGRCLKMK